MRREPFLRRVFRLPASSARLERSVDDELRFHLDERVREFMARGMTRDEAEAEARKRFGDYDSYSRHTRDVDAQTMTIRNRIELVDTLRREVPRAARLLARAPGFAAIAILTLALGIGATTAIYSVVKGVLLNPLPYPNPEALVSVMHPTSAPGSGERQWGLASVGYFHFREHASTLEALGVYRSGMLSVAEPGQPAQQVRMAQVTASLFDVFQARPHLGRLVTAEDDLPGLALRTVVLSYEFWRHYYGEDPDIVGRTIQTSAFPLEIIGVTQPGLTLPRPGAFASSADLTTFGVDLWVPLNLDPATRQNNHAFAGVGRLAPGATADAAQRELSTMTGQFSALFPDVYSQRFMESYNFRAGVTPLHDEVLGPTIGRALWILFGAVALVLVIAAANVANLFLVRMEARRRDAAVRAALGADRRHMAVHYLSESLMLTLAAGALGVVLARVGLAAMLAIAPRNVPRLVGVELDGSSLLFALALAVVAGISLGVMPLPRATSVDVDTLRDGARGLGASRRQRMARHALVVAQVALAMMLLVASGLMIRSFMHLRDVQPGLDASGVLTLGVSLPYRSYETMEQAAAFHREFGERVGALPGVVAIGASGALPLRDYGTGCSVVFRENRPYASGEPTPCVHTVPATPGFFDALGITVRGRAPDWGDVSTKTQAVVVTEVLARRLWPGEDAIGKGIGTNGPDSPWWYRVVGVVPELRAGGLDQPPTEAVFLAASPLYPAQNRWGMLNGLVVAVKVARGQPDDLIGPIRRVLTEMDAQIPMVNPVTMETVVDRSIARTSFVMALLSIAAAIALLLSAVGLYGVISYLVAQRRAEIGVRIALGASVSRVLRMVMGESARLALLGVALGLLGAFLGTRLLQALLFGVSPTDSLVLTVVPIVLLAITALASFLPARRAARLDPAEALRNS
ncbi:MAG: ABC transporter permease [Gemmatimonadaceae bacterium]